MGDRPWGASSSIKALKNSNQSRHRGSSKSKHVWDGVISPGNRFQKQGKGGNDVNRFHALSAPDFEDYEECFPSLPRVSKAQIKEVRSAVKCSDPSGVTTFPVSDRVEEGRRLERLTVKALNRAKKGRSKLTQEEVANLESWLARYRVSNDQSVFVAPAVVCEKRENAQMPDKMDLTEPKEKQVSGVDKVKTVMEASTVEVESAVSLADAGGEGCDKSSSLLNKVEGKSENVGEEESDDQGDGSVGKGSIGTEGTKSDSKGDETVSEDLDSESKDGDQGAGDDSGSRVRVATQGAREDGRTVPEADGDKEKVEDEECGSSNGDTGSEVETGEEVDDEVISESPLLLNSDCADVAALEEIVDSDTKEKQARETSEGSCSARHVTRRIGVLWVTLNYGKGRGNSRVYSEVKKTYKAQGVNQYSMDQPGAAVDMPQSEEGTTPQIAEAEETSLEEEPAQEVNLVQEVEDPVEKEDQIAAPCQTANHSDSEDEALCTEGGEEADHHHEVKRDLEIRKEAVLEASISGPKEPSMDVDEGKGDEEGSGEGEHDDGFSDSSGSDSVPDKGGCDQVGDANQGLAAIQVYLPDFSPAGEGGVNTDSERRLSLALVDIREGANGDENFRAHHMFDELPHNVCSYYELAGDTYEEDGDVSTKGLETNGAVGEGVLLPVSDEDIAKEEVPLVKPLVGDGRGDVEGDDLMEVEKVDIEKVIFSDSNLYLDGNCLGDNVLDSMTDSANRELQTVAKGCIVSDAHDMLDKMPKKDMLCNSPNVVSGNANQDPGRTNQVRTGKPNFDPFNVQSAESGVENNWMFMNLNGDRDKQTDLREKPKIDAPKVFDKMPLSVAQFKGTSVPQSRANKAFDNLSNLNGEAPVMKEGLGNAKMWAQIVTNSSGGKNPGV
ncbi:hypothetical protein U1Q18_036422 [Sarracenia purpurea var. burkii]